MSIKTLSIIALAAGALGLCSAAYADQNCSQGAYIGGQFGYGNADYGISGHGYNEGNLAGRAYVGYQFNPNFGLETGYTVFEDNTVNHTSLKLKTEQWDILAKAGMPFGNGFRGDIKAGAARVNSTPSDKSVSIVDSYNWNPAAGASVSYSLNKNFAVDVAYLHTFGSSNNHNDLNPDTDLATLGVSYHFA